MKAEDLDYISKRINNLRDLIKNDYYNSVDDIISEINNIKNDAEERSVPIVIIQEEFTERFRVKMNGLPPEYEENSEEEYSEEYSEEED